jgi:hypothetical protein
VNKRIGTALYVRHRGNLEEWCDVQGEVESISLMKPKALTEHDTGMLEFLEEIIGTSRFHSFPFFDPDR